MPATPSISVTVLSGTTVEVYVTAGSDTTHIQFDRSWVDNGGGTNDFEIALSSGSSTYQYFSIVGLTTGSYTIQARARSGSTASSWVSRGFSLVVNTRPTEFSWNSSKSSEGMYNLTYSEWSGFLAKINEFRTFKGLVTRSFDTSLTPGAINSYVEPSANSFNAARNAINDMSPAYAPPPSVSSNQRISALALNTMVSALNSIT